MTEGKWRASDSGGLRSTAIARSFAIVSKPGERAKSGSAVSSRRTKSHTPRVCETVFMTSLSKPQVARWPDARRGFTGKVCSGIRWREDHLNGMNAPCTRNKRIAGSQPNRRTLPGPRDGQSRRNSVLNSVRGQGPERVLVARRRKIASQHPLGCRFLPAEVCQASSSEAPLKGRSLAMAMSIGLTADCSPM
jgi:hypothetical protein